MLLNDDGVIEQAGALFITPETATGRLSMTALSVVEGAGAVTTDQDYTSYGELDTVSFYYDGTLLYSRDYGYDALGRVKTLDESVRNESDPTVYDTVSYEYYYASGILDYVEADGNIVEEYEYNGYSADHNGVRTQATLRGTTYIAGPANDWDQQLTYGNLSYTYTDNGALETRTGYSVNPGAVTEYSYDALGNLRQVTLPDTTVIDYRIDGMNRRVGKVVDGTLEKSWLYLDQLNPLAELDSAGNVTEFVYGTRGNVPDYMIKDGHTYRILSNHLGSVRLVIDVDDGTLAQRIDYDSYGQVLLDTNEGFQPFGFAGGLYDPETGLVRFGARAGLALKL